MELPHNMPDNGQGPLAAGLAKISLVIRHGSQAGSTRNGLSPTQAQIIALLAGRPPAGLAVSRIAAELAVTQPTVSDAVGALVRKRLVEKARSDADGRVVLVRLTAGGRAQAAETALWPDVLRQALGELDADERAVFARALVKMIRSLQENGRIPVSRMCISCTYFRPHAHAGQRRPHHCAYVDAPLGDDDLRIDCPDHGFVSPEQRPRLWQLFVGGRTPAGAIPDVSIQKRSES